MGITGALITMAGIPPFIDVSVAESESALHMLAAKIERRFVKWKVLQVGCTDALERNLQKHSDEGWTLFGAAAACLLLYRYDARD